MTATSSPPVDPSRSRQMALVRAKDTAPEMIVRRLAHSLGKRYRLHRRDLPGTPDLVFPSLRKVVLVHGCFWHRHDDPMCWRSRLPKTRVDFWTDKLSGNAERDQRQLQELDALGWRVMVVWECETTKTKRDQLKSRLADFLSG
jgi:DNA mismatch endonuclease (patch repair protein)